jgi:hypothetical protein
MAHYAFLDENNIVTEVIVGKDEGEDGIDWEQYYGNFRGQVCKRTSYNTFMGVYYKANSQIPHEDQSKAFRLNFAARNMEYIPRLDAFVYRTDNVGWILNESTGIYDPPIPFPDDGKRYDWDNQTLNWVERDNS